MLKLTLTFESKEDFVANWIRIGRKISEEWTGDPPKKLDDPCVDGHSWKKIDVWGNAEICRRCDHPKK